MRCPTNGSADVDSISLDRYKEVLLAKRRELSASVARSLAPAPGADGHGGDFVDRATADAEAELQVRLRETDTRLLRAIEEALARIDEGTFGICEACEHPIASPRLNAVPWTRLCRDCKEQNHMSSDPASTPAPFY